MPEIGHVPSGASEVDARLRPSRLKTGDFLGVSVAQIHRTAVVEDGADLADDVVVEAYARIGATAKLGAGCLVKHGAIIESGTYGRNNTIHPYACVGVTPQDKKYRGEKTSLLVGDNNTIREHVTISIGTEGGGRITKIGDNNLFMASSHVGHDCVIGNHCIIANFAGIAGHCRLDDFAIVGGQAGLHQFVRVGTSVFVGGGSKVGKDVPPFTFAQGYPARLRGINAVGLQRRQLGDDTVRALKRAYRSIFYSEEGFEANVARTREEHGGKREVLQFLEFLEESTSSGRGFIRPDRGEEKELDKDELF